MYVLIIGCGKIGSNLAQKLSLEGNDVVIVDNNDENLLRLGSSFNGTRIKGVEIDMDVLEEAGIGNVDVLLAMTQDDNKNIMVSEIAKNIFGIKKVIARVFDINREFMYKKLGIQTINTTELVTNIIKTKIIGNTIQIISILDENNRIISVPILKLKEYLPKDFEKKYNCIISAIIRNGKMIYPSPEKLLQKNDKIICTISKEECDRISHILQKEW